jgi:hypothetical protein
VLAAAAGAADAEHDAAEKETRVTIGAANGKASFMFMSSSPSSSSPAGSSPFCWFFKVS